MEEFAVKINGLTCCGEERPIGVAGKPSFFFSVAASPDFTYGGCQIQVASDYDKLNGGTPDMFDSGTVRGEMRPVVYAGKPLAPFTRYYWRARVIGMGTDISDYSDIGEFVTGAVVRSDWNAATFRSDGRVSFIRRNFAAGDTPESAFLFIAGRGELPNSAVVYINGSRVDIGEAFPGPSAAFSMSMRGVDVTELIRRRNTMIIGFSGSVSAVVRMCYPGGGCETAETDGEWELLQGSPCSASAGSERYDAGGTAAVLAPDAPASGLRPEYGCSPVYIRPSPCFAVSEERIIAKAVRPASSGWLFDFGRQVRGYAEIAVRDADAPVCLKYFGQQTEGEDIGAGAGECVFIPAGLASERYRPAFFRTAFRYVLVEGLSYRPELTDAVAFTVTSAPKKAEFFCSDEDINRVFDCAAKTFSANLLWQPTERPDDAAGSPGFALSADVQLLINDAEGTYRRFFENAEDSQSVGGYLPSSFPSVSAPTDLIRSAAFIPAVYALYNYTGDRGLLERYMPSAELLMNALRRVSGGGASFGGTLFAFGDLYAEEPAGADFLGMAFFFRAAETMSLWCAALRDRDGADRYRELALRSGNAINEKYLRFTAGRYFYEKGTQSANTVALAFGFCPEKARPSVAEALADDIKLKGRLTCGYIANTYVFGVLSENGFEDTAYSLIKNGALPAFLRSSGASAFTLNEKGESPLNAAFAGGYAKWIVEKLAGVSLEAPGGKRIKICPYMPDGISEMSLSLGLADGEISVYWQRNDGGISMDISVPTDCEAVLCLPVNNSRLGGRESGDRFIFRTGKHHITINDRSTKSL